MILTRYLCALTCAFAGCVNAGEVTVAVASNFAVPMKLIVSEFEKRSGHRVHVAFGSSNKFYSQIQSGAPFEALFSADQSVPKALVRDDLAVTDSRFTYAVGALVLWSAEAGLVDDQGAVLRRQKRSRLAIANPKLAPYGAAAAEVLSNLGMVTQALDFKLVQGANIAQAYQFVATGNADVGFVSASQVIRNGVLQSGSAWLVPQHLYSPIRQDVVLLRQGEKNQAAHQLLQFMRSDTARVIISSFGYQTETGQP